MAHHSEIACLSKATIFKNLPLPLKKKLVTISSHQDFFPKGSFIRQPLDGKDGMIFLDSGHAKVYTLNTAGKETVLEVLNKGDSTGQENLFSTGNHENFIQATEDCLVCSMKRHDFQMMLKDSPDLALSLLNDFGERLITAEKNTVRRNSMNAKERVLDYLKDHGKKLGKTSFNLPLQKKDLANFLGLTPETLSRQLNALQASGQIIVKGQFISLN
ncbi:CRP FNR family transcriptional regulator [Limosilactobacillus frumenti DSM 13145]|uniref:CRP FNR family transcriptional regulator n=1 Tax=Limosilactobacillus frumenti DSM 13145 TaxID=1423746 RepID=A0A0R1P8Y3_9LACO|nr:Crp/Fnr family transcriptional regulator [Limosilactobacillus frumenti]KRL26026.1 CRP FNR family transcriptional regulator [Limosilactobacillus frumenti DSM 13145]MBA2913964.1 Crp/Fnr family transcriptional regulator [Limosilactobacillus frumenti]QFG71967.1 Crp/Fnr family transcriptional regulator [Limosilactobacillus frumenti]